VKKAKASIYNPIVVNEEVCSDRKPFFSLNPKILGKPMNTQKEY